MKKEFWCDKKICTVELVKEGMFYVVKVDGVVYKKTANETFAVECFVSI